MLFEAIVIPHKKSVMIHNMKKNKIVPQKKQNGKKKGIVKPFRK